MTREYPVMIEGQLHYVIVSDDREALLAAKAAGKASVGLWQKGESQGWLPADHVIESVEDVDREYLEQAARRHLGLPWVIIETKRLMLREFKAGDESRIPAEPGEGGADRIFRNRKSLEDYIHCQYGFYGYGIWAVVDRKEGTMVGKAGVTNLTGLWECVKDADALDIGYHIFSPYRRQGLALEACKGVLEWYRRHMDCPLYAKIDASNEASISVAKKLGFGLKDQKYIGSGQWLRLYEWNC